MLEIDMKLGSKHVSPWMEERICISGESVLANRGIVLGIMVWSVQLQLDDGGENS
jgi:hypothetical protein